MLDYRKPYILVTKGMSGQITPYDLEAWEGKGRGLPSIAIGVSCGKVDDKYHDKRKTYLIYYDIGSERGHDLPGRIIKELPNGVIFEWDDGTKGAVKPQFKLTELTMEEFELRVRPTLDEYVSNCIHDLDDAYVFYRRMAGIT